MKNKYFCWLFLLFTLVSLGASAQVKVEGSVFDEMDNPLIGVSGFYRESQDWCSDRCGWSFYDYCAQY